MLKPSMQELLSKVDNRYLLVNLVAQRARDLADQSEESGDALEEKTVKLALDEVADGSIVYCSGPRISQVLPQMMPELSGAFSLVLDEEELESAEDSAEETEEDE